MEIDNSKRRVRKVTNFNLNDDVVGIVLSYLLPRNHTSFQLVNKTFYSAYSKSYFSMQYRMVKDLWLLSRYDEPKNVDIIYGNMLRVLQVYGTQREIDKMQKIFLKLDIPQCLKNHQLSLDVLDDCRLDKLKEFWNDTKILESTRDRDGDEHVCDTFKLVAMIGENRVSWKLERTEFGWSGTRVEMTVSLVVKGQVRDENRDVSEEENEGINDDEDNSEHISKDGNEDEEGDDEIDKDEHTDRIDVTEDIKDDSEHVPEDEEGDEEETSDDVDESEDEDDNEEASEKIHENTLIQMNKGEFGANKEVIVSLKGKGKFGDLTEKEIILLLFLIPAVHDFDDQEELQLLREYLTGTREWPDR